MDIGEERTPTVSKVLVDVLRDHWEQTEQRMHGLRLKRDEVGKDPPMWETNCGWGASHILQVEAAPVDLDTAV